MTDVQLDASDVFASPVLVSPSDSRLRIAMSRLSRSISGAARSVSGAARGVSGLARDDRAAARLDAGIALRVRARTAASLRAAARLEDSTMNNRQERTLQALRRVDGFLATTSLQPLPPLLTKMRRQLSRSIARITDMQSTQSTSRVPVDDPLNVNSLRRRVRRDRMMPLVKIAKPLLKFAPGTAAALRIPHARADAATVAAAALDLATVLTPHTKLIISAGQGRNCLQDLRADARALKDAVHLTEKARQQRSRATQIIAAEFKKSAGTLTVIEGILMPRFAADPPLAVAWRSCRRVTARTGRPRTKKRRRDAEAAVSLRN